MSKIMRSDVSDSIGDDLRAPTIDSEDGVHVMSDQMIIKAGAKACVIDCEPRVSQE